MVNFGKAKIFKGQVTQAINSRVGRKFAAADLLKQFADGFGVQVRLLE